jgi:hypothetical protein
LDKTEKGSGGKENLKKHARQGSYHISIISEQKVDLNDEPHATSSSPLVTSSASSSNGQNRDKSVSGDDVDINNRSFVLFEKKYHKPGVYVEIIKAPSVPISSRITVRMRNQQLQLFSDSFNVNLNTEYYRLLKYFVTLPFIFMVTAIIYRRVLQPSKAIIE